MAQSHAASTQEKRLLGVVDQFRCGLKVCVVRMHPVFACCAGGHGNLAFLHLNIEDIRRQLEKDRPRPSLGGMPESDGEVFGNPFNIETGGYPLGDRLDDVDLFDFLQSALKIVTERMPATEYNQRRVVQVSVGDAGKAVGKTGPRREEADA